MSERRARLLDLRRRARRCSPGARQQDAERIRDAMVAGFTAPRARQRCVDLDARRRRRADRRLIDATGLNDLPACTTTARATPTTRCCSARRSRAASRRTAACTFRRPSRTSTTRQFDGATRACRRSPRGCSRRSPRAIRSPPSCAAICREAFDFPAPLVPLDMRRRRLSVLELFHGPTCAFKDFGARFLAACLERIRRGAAAQADDSGRDLGRYRRRGRGRVSQPALGRRRRCCIRRGSSPSGRRSSSPAGAATCARSRCAARSTTASAW